jgi:hypothetical protein
LLLLHGAADIVDVKPSRRIKNDARVEKDESHAGKIVERHWCDEPQGDDSCAWRAFLCLGFSIAASLTVM